MSMVDLLGRVGWKLYRVRLAEVGGAAHLAPSAVLGEKLLVETDRAFAHSGEFGHSFRLIPATCSG